MRALVRGAVNNVRTSILLDTGANVSIITTKLARRLRLEPIQEHGRQLEVQEIQEGKMSTTTRVKAKVTLGSNTVYEFEFWVVLYQKWSGIRLDLLNATAKLPGEEMVPLVKSLSADDDSAERMLVAGGLTKNLPIPAGEWISDAKKEPIIRNARRLDAAHCCADPDDDSVPEREANLNTIDEYHGKGGVLTARHI
ncbi:LOW QUALITY PROTEIN: Eukaryotic/viral aspartic protease [Phytophthora megakarya]|uniref:Eukaryotic/viral aspartic protease n=1 Tax=Phytophthora megakarya TaxID=4795 RepID=A0A225VQS5_9STRA|nr:LOW QUALITY PROTEIN: Eukaryotic/viral aspartic protease [Phytophthora megakarya]